MDKQGNVDFCGYRPGAIGRVVQLHALYYSKEWGFDLIFEAKVASELSAFLTRFEPNRDLFRLALIDSEIAGSITIDGSETDGDAAHLRWFILAPSARGLGLGRTLLDQAITFARDAGFAEVYLWTFKGLGAAAHLYESAGFTVTEERAGSQWGKTVTEQRMVLAL